MSPAVSSTLSSSSPDEVDDHDEKEEVEVALKEMVGDGSRLGGVTLSVIVGFRGCGFCG